MDRLNVSPFMSICAFVLISKVPIRTHHTYSNPVN